MGAAARYLGINAGRTANAQRHRAVPEQVQPYLLRVAAGKRPEDSVRCVNGGAARRPRAKEQLAQLDQGTLAQLLALLAETKHGGTPVK